jgi:hypothetical protein
MSKYHVSRAAVLAFAGFAFAAFAPGLRAQTLSTQCNPVGAQAAWQQRDNYTALKDLEGCFQLPASSLTQVVGTFDPVTGNFAYAPQVTQKQIMLPLGPAVVIPRQPGQPIVVTGGNAANPSAMEVSHLVGLLPANAVNVGLSFQSANGTPIQVFAKQMAFSTWSTTQVSCQTNNGGCPWPQTATPADWSAVGATATVNAGQASTVEFTLKSGTKSFTGYLLIVRPPVIGVGAFTVPAIPLTIVYAPPLGQLRKNTNSFSITSSSGTTLNMSVSQDNSTTTPTDFVQSNVTDANSLQSAVSQIPGLSEIPVGKALAAEIGILNQITGSISGNTTQGVTTTQNHSLTVNFQSTDSFPTQDISGGPGLDDTFVFLKNAQFMWVARNGRLSVSLIKAILAVQPASDLLQHKDSPQEFIGLDSKTIKSLLALDPFTAPYVNVPYSPALVTSNGLLLPAGWIPPRWRNIGEDELGSAAIFSNTYSVQQSDTTTTTNYSTEVLDAKAGMLSFMATGPDVTQTQSTKTTATFSASTTVTSGLIQTTTASFSFASGEQLDLMAYYDVVFGTFAFVPQASAPQALYAGLAAPGQLVVLQIGGQAHITRTDAQGRYAFHSRNITPGSLGTLFAGGVSRQIQIGAPMARLIPGAIPVQRQPR